MTLTFLERKNIFFTKKNIAKNFGTRRIYLSFLYQKVLCMLGFFDRYKHGVNFSEVRRLVFVCQGNIFRSAYAEVAVKKKGIETCSFGLTAMDGDSPPEIARMCAKESGVDLEGHRATSRYKAEIVAGDLVVVMDYSQLKEVQGMGAGVNVQYTMLGLWSRGHTYPVVLDPYGRGKVFCRNVYIQINDCLDELTKQYGY